MVLAFALRFSIHKEITPDGLKDRPAYFSERKAARLFFAEEYEIKDTGGSRNQKAAEKIQEVFFVLPSLCRWDILFPIR